MESMTIELTGPQVLQALAAIRNEIEQARARHKHMLAETLTDTYTALHAQHTYHARGRARA